MTAPLLLIAIGNSLRHDDNAGHELAARLEPLLRAAGIMVDRLDLHQLVPETAEAIMRAGMVVFLDASITETSVVWRELTPADSTAATMHALSPERILEMANRYFGPPPPCFLITVPGKDFSHGEGLSRATRIFLEEAVGFWSRIADAYRSYNM